MGLCVLRVNMYTHVCNMYACNMYVIYMYALEPFVLWSFRAITANPFELARAICTLKLQSHRARSLSVRVRSSQLHFSSFRGTGLEANPLEHARAICNLNLQDHRARSQSARFRSSQLRFDGSGPQCSKPIRMCPSLHACV